MAIAVSFSQSLQQDALIVWEASQRGEVVDSATAIAQIRVNMRSRYSSPTVY